MNSLKGVKVLELAGLAPAPFAGKILKDFGATVIRIEKIESTPDVDVFKEGKLTLYVDLKKNTGQAFVKSICRQADVLIDPFRAGVLEKMNLNPNELVALNKRLIVARLTGYGQQTGDGNDLALRSGHDINYIALSGLLSQFTTAKAGDKPVFPVNILGDFAAGGLMCAFGICLSLLERERTGLGQIIDSNITESTSYIGSWLFKTRRPDTEMQYLVWPNLREKHANLLDGGRAFYGCYECKDGKYMALGALEPKFFEQFIASLHAATQAEEAYRPFKIDQIDQFDDDLADKLEAIFKLKTRDEWSSVFLGTDSCCTPVLEPEEVHSFEYFKKRKSFLDQFTPNVSPRFLTNQAGQLEKSQLEKSQLEKSQLEKSQPEKPADLVDVLNSLKVDTDQLDSLIRDGVVRLDRSKL